MNAVFDRADYEAIHKIVFRDDYPGYKPTVIESPNGDGKLDVEKRYAHISIKNFTNVKDGLALMPYLQKAHNLAVEVAHALKLQPQYMPDITVGALRVLDYPAGAISNLHTDTDLFTLMCYRDQVENFVSQENDTPAITTMRRFNTQAHVGRLGTEIGLGPATPHEVTASQNRQCSMVYFAIPPHDSVLPSGVTVRNWLNEAMSKMRSDFKAYE
jgi:hypothetical protein